MNKPSISNDLELAEKALEVMGWVTTDAKFEGYTAFYRENDIICILSTNPLSNDLAAEGKRWLRERKYPMHLSFATSGDVIIEVILGELKFVKTCPTENEAVLRAVVEIGK